MRQQHEAFLNSLAARLGVSQRWSFNEAFKNARIDQINKAVADGRIDQDGRTGSFRPSRAASTRIGSG